jgi:hypothetical protein
MRNKADINIRLAIRGRLQTAMAITPAFRSSAKADAKTGAFFRVRGEQGAPDAYRKKRGPHRLPFL